MDDGNGKYNLMLLCWGEGQASGIHDHANSHCFMKMLKGSLEEIRYSWPQSDGSALAETGRTPLLLNDVCYINGKYFVFVKNILYYRKNLAILRYLRVFNNLWCGS